jgi:hypothetical protein
MTAQPKAMQKINDRHTPSAQKNPIMFGSQRLHTSSRNARPHIQYWLAYQGFSNRRDENIRDEAVGGSGRPKGHPALRRPGCAAILRARRGEGCPERPVGR